MGRLTKYYGGSVSIDRQTSKNAFLILKGYGWYHFLFQCDAMSHNKNIVTLRMSRVDCNCMICSFGQKTPSMICSATDRYIRNVNRKFNKQPRSKLAK